MTARNSMQGLAGQSKHDVSLFGWIVNLLFNGLHRKSIMDMGVLLIARLYMKPCINFVFSGLTVH